MTSGVSSVITNNMSISILIQCSFVMLWSWIHKHIKSVGHSPYHIDLQIDDKQSFKIIGCFNGIDKRAYYYGEDIH